MAKQKRAERLAAILEKTQELSGQIHELMVEIDTQREGLEDTNLAHSEKYEALENCIEALNELLDCYDEVQSSGEFVEFP